MRLAVHPRNVAPHTHAHAHAHAHAHTHTHAQSYAEIRYCPSLHRQGGLGDDAIVTAVEQGLRRATEAYPSCRFYQIITVLRDLGPSEAMVMAKLACKHAGSKLVVGIDLAGNEITHPPELFCDAFDYAHGNGMGITIHAGEGRPTDPARWHARVRVQMRARGSDLMRVAATRPLPPRLATSGVPP